VGVMAALRMTEVTTAVSVLLLRPLSSCRLYCRLNSQISCPRSNFACGRI
jgi:hypothetical protein